MRQYIANRLYSADFDSDVNERSFGSRRELTEDMMNIRIKQRNSSDDRNSGKYVEIAVLTGPTAIATESIPINEK